MAKKISTQYDFLKIPIKGIVPESASTAPATPVAGQLWLDTSVSPNRLKVYENGTWVLASQTGTVLTTQIGAASGVASLDGAIKVPIAQIPTGTTSTTVPFGNDARFTDTRVPTDGSVTGGPAGAGVKIAANTITTDNIAAALKDAADGVTSLRQLGYTSTKAMPGVARLDQIAVPTATVSFNSQELSNLGAPSGPNSAARLADVQTAQAGIDNKPSVRLVAITQRALTGLTAIDGVTPIAGNRILLTGQTAPAENGSWIAASGAWARSTDTVTSGSFWMVEEGTTYGASQWKVATADPIVVGTTALTINQWGAGSVYTGTTNRVTVTGQVIDISSSYVGQASITTLGTITTGVWTGTDVAVADGGTGSSTAAGARTNLGAVGKYAADLGALSAGVEATVTHNLNSLDTTESFKILADATKTDLAVRTIDANSIGVTSDVAYGAAAIRVVVHG